ncbi:probable LRR receptor-like serine/threonine-protein kinase At3g47570 [Punica granatum]|uniref:Probable LRR receptor-like serine/threonine-protein kinase At3g47570 n=1 Tax=Punica granatum TaxID=22663 RepID=A0A6P8D6B5_PUNGR|nr:probable LRR receptor-like serine/threonine-protein kinase At3g47570 [Punica granatum]
MESQLTLPHGRSPAATLWLLHCITAISLVACSMSSAKWTHGNENDHLALLEFKANTIDPVGVLSSWNSSHHICEWFGVTCGRRHWRVTRLELKSQGLSGTISPHIGNLNFLRVLHLGNNSFHSRIPLEVDRLSRLEYFLLYNNSLHGPIPPSLRTCSNLVSISLFNNKLEGQLPVDLGFLSKLKRLTLALNELNGVIPASIGNLTSLEHLIMDDNKLGGRIPDTLGNLRNLKTLALWDNNLAGNLPSSIINISSMEFLYLYNNQLVGDVPSFQQMSNLYWFSAADNYLGSEQANDLNFLCSLANSTTLKTLLISENKLGGAMPKCIGKMSNTLDDFQSHANALSGTLPSSIGYLIGSIPSSLGKCQSLLLLDLSKNKLAGAIPPEIMSLSSLSMAPTSRKTICLESFPWKLDNMFTGPIPSTLSSLKGIQELNLSHNRLPGELPKEGVFANTSATSVLGNKELCGGLPEYRLPKCKSTGKSTNGRETEENRCS